MNPIIVPELEKSEYTSYFYGFLICRQGKIEYIEKARRKLAQNFFILSCTSQIFGLLQYSVIRMFVPDQSKPMFSRFSRIGYKSASTYSAGSVSNILTRFSFCHLTSGKYLNLVIGQICAGHSRRAHQIPYSLWNPDSP